MDDGSQQEVIEMALCESVRLGLRPGILYRFKAYDDCEMCLKMEREHKLPTETNGQQKTKES